MTEHVIAFSFPFYGPWLLLWLFSGLLLAMYLADVVKEWVYRQRNRRLLGNEDVEREVGSFQVREQGSKVRARHLRRVNPEMTVGSRRGMGGSDWKSSEEWSPTGDKPAKE